MPCSWVCTYLVGIISRYQYVILSLEELVWNMNVTVMVMSRKSPGINRRKIVKFGAPQYLVFWNAKTRINDLLFFL